MHRILLVAVAILLFSGIGRTQVFSFEQQINQAFALTSCAFGTTTCFLEWDSADPLGSRTPLIIIHGQNPNTIPGRPKLELFEPFILRYTNDVSLKTRYKIYFFAYFSNVVSIEELGRRLQDDLASKDRQDSVFASRQIVILAHSMGGLVARSYMNQYGGQRVLKLITLGTPHHGSPMANGPARDAKTVGLWSLAQILFDNLYFSVFGPAWYTVNRSDLRWDNYNGLFNYSLFFLERNIWLENLNASRTNDGKIIAYYGNYAPAGDCTGVFAPFAAYCYGSTLLGGAMGLVNDGIVPVSSATFVDTRGIPRVETRSFDGYNHDDIVAGKSDGLLLTSIRTDLLNLVTAPLPVPTTNAPFGSFDTPEDYSTLSGEVAMTGWALDDDGVTRVDIYRSAVRGEVTPNGLVYVGSANFVAGARPDIARAYPSLPNSNRAGWGYMLMTNLLPGQGNEGFLFVAYAYDAEGNLAGLGGKNLNFNNRASSKPFGTIDTPGQGETVSGVYTNFGWALTPQPNLIATNGSTIDVYIDNKLQGHPVYNNYRSDIASLFSGLRNTNGAVGYFQLDTRGLANGLHTIAWFVRDSAGNSQGIGSRYFTVRN